MPLSAVLNALHEGTTLKAPGSPLARSFLRPQALPASPPSMAIRSEMAEREGLNTQNT